MGVHGKELVHSRILATFLNRTGSHKLGANFLNRFIMALASPQTPLFSGEAVEVQVLSEAVKPNVHSQVYRELNCIDLIISFLRINWSSVSRTRLMPVSRKSN